LQSIHFGLYSVFNVSLAVLRQQLAAVVAGTPSSTPGLPTGVSALDMMLPGGGVPRGRLTELLAPAGLGKTTIARSLVAATIRGGGGVAWIDATRTLDPRDWADPDAHGGRENRGTSGIRERRAAGGAFGAFDALWVVRPGDPARGPWCADLLLRSGAFALVVLDGAPVLPRAVAVRLTQLARESDAALLLLGEGTRASEVGGALRLRLAWSTYTGITPVVPRSPGAAAHRVIATLEKGGPYQHIELEVGRGHGTARRLCTHPEIPDRRGVARSRSAIRGRRFAQPEYPRQR
jgi:hypothetical protein